MKNIELHVSTWIVKQRFSPATKAGILENLQNRRTCMLGNSWTP